jgi:hypothetical protein
MTVLTELCDVKLPWTGVETSFAPGFPARDADHVKAEHITAAGVVTALTRGIHFNVALASETRIATLTPIALPPAPADIRIYRRTPATHSNQFLDSVRYPQSVHEDIADRAAMRAAENRKMAADALAGIGEVAGNAAEAKTARDQAVAARNATVRVYLGEGDEFPLTDPAGQPLVNGARFLLTGSIDPEFLDGEYNWRNGNWYRIAGDPALLKRVWKVVVTADMAATGIVPVPGGYIAGFVDVFKNGRDQDIGAALGTGLLTDPDCVASDGATVAFRVGEIFADDVVKGVNRHPFTPGEMLALSVEVATTGGITQPTAQAALEELHQLKAPKQDPSFLGTVSLVAMLFAGGSRILEAASKMVLRAKGDLFEVRTADDANAILAADYAAARPTFKGSALALVSDIVAPGLPAGNLFGMATANNAVDAVNDIDIAAGIARDSTGTVTITGTAMTKRLDAAWAAGTNQGGLDTGAKANNTWYHLFAIAKAGGADPDYLFSTSPTAPTLPASYTAFRRIWSVRTDGAGAILPYLQYGDLCSWTTLPADFNATVGAPSTITLQVPPIAGVIANLQGLAMHASIVGTNVYIERVGQAANGNGPAARTQVANVWAHYRTSVPVNGSGQIRAEASQTNTLLTVCTESYLDRRGRDQ